MSADILQRGQWVDTSIDLYIGTLVEYDMRDGGLNILKEYKLLPPYMIERVEKLKKGTARNQFVGKLKYHELYHDVPKIQNEKFKELRMRFGEMNELEDSDIFAVRKDAIFVKRYCYETRIGEFIEFREKNVYDAMMRINSNNSNIEFYWKPNDKTLDVKGLVDHAVRKHDGYLNEMIWTFMKHLASFDEDSARRYIVSIIDKYKFLELEPEYYRMYDKSSAYQMIINNEVVLIDDVGASEIPNTNIGYNFTNLLVPMLQLIDK